MTRRVLARCTVVLVAVIGLIATSQVRGEQDFKGFRAPNDGPQSIEEYEALKKELSNWGRWGQDDNLGAVNLITPEKIAEAATLVKTGQRVSMAHAVLQESAADMPNPFDLSGNGSKFTYTFHSTTHSHLDAVCQFDYKGVLFNGHRLGKDIKDENGCHVLDTDALKDGLITRGILLDIPRLKGLPYLEPGTAVYPADVEAWEEMAGVKVSSGDAIFLRTGRWARRAVTGPWQLYPAPPGEGEAGYHTDMARWFKERDVAIVGADVSNDVTPHLDAAAEVLAETRLMPVHSLAIVDLGIVIVDAMDLEAVAEMAAKLNRWEFMVVGAPPRIERGTGSLINLIAIF